MESWLSTTIVVVASILTVFNLVDRIIAYANKPKETVDELKRRIEMLERKTDEDFKQKFDNIDAEIGNLKESNKVLIGGMLALLEHSLDGNNTKGLEKSKEELTEYLKNKQHRKGVFLMEGGKL